MDGRENICRNPRFRFHVEFWVSSALEKELLPPPLPLSVKYDRPGSFIEAGVGCPTLTPIFRIKSFALFHLIKVAAFSCWTFARWMSALLEFVPSLLGFFLNNAALS